MDRRLLFIGEVLRDVAKYLEKKNNSKSTYSYEKGYLAEADILVHNNISHAILEYFPDDLVYSEEDETSFSYQIPDDSYLWMIDPICGSANYTKGFPFYVHALSVFDKEGVLYAGVYHPKCDELFLANRHETTLNGSRVQVSNIQNLDEALVAVNCNQAAWKRKDPSLNSLVDHYAPPVTRRIHILESANLEMAYVACGRLDAYINPDDKIWDIAAGLLMISSAGGKTKIMNGSLIPPFDNNMGIIATNNFLMESIEGHLFKSNNLDE